MKKQNCLQKENIFDYQLILGHCRELPYLNCNIYNSKRVWGINVISSHRHALILMNFAFAFSADVLPNFTKFRYLCCHSNKLINIALNIRELWTGWPTHRHMHVIVWIVKISFTATQSSVGHLQHQNNTWKCNCFSCDILRCFFVITVVW